MVVQRGMVETVAERLTLLDERVRALQENNARDASATLERLTRMEASQSALARAVAEQDRAHAVLAQWMRDWTAEVAAWRTGLDKRMAEAEARQEQMAQEADQARGALRVAMWAFGTILTLVTGVFTGVIVRVLGEVVTRAGH